MANNDDSTRIIRGQKTTRLVREDPETAKITPAPSPAASGDDPKTVVLGVGGTAPGAGDSGAEGAAAAPDTSGAGPVVGWLVVVEGAGRGQFRGIFNGVNSIGRSEDQRISLNFGDEAISRNDHATIIFDEKTNLFYLERGKSANLLRLNGDAVIGQPKIANGDELNLGQTKLRFVALCGESFTWSEQVETE